MKPLRPYQAEALEAIKASVKSGVRRLVVQAPTGSGKTRVAAEISLGAQGKGNKLVFVVPAISLIDQTVEMFFAEGVRDIGVIQANHPMTNWAMPIQIASIQTIRSRGSYPEAHVVLFDEVHNLHKEHIKWLEHPAWKDVPFIGLSATPWTRGLGKYFESLLVMSTTEELIKQGYLAKFRVFAADHPDLSKVRTSMGDYHEGDLTKVMQQDALVANIIDTYKAKWGKGKTFCFGVDCAHAQMLQARFLAANIPCAYQDAKTTMSERAEIKRGFHNGTYQVVCNVGTLTTGVDWDVRCLILARPTKSEMLFVQIIGRALRTAEGKDRAIILDHTDTTSRLGFVTDIHHEMLSQGKFNGTERPKSSPRLPKPCPRCACLIPLGTRACPACGYEKKVESSRYERDGELVEFNGFYREKGDRQANTYSLKERAAFFAQLKGYALMKGYKPWWAKFKYKDKFGELPPWSIQDAKPMTPGIEVQQWIKYTIILWQQEKRKKAGSAGGGRYASS